LVLGVSCASATPRESDGQSGTQRSRVAERCPAEKPAKDFSRLTTVARIGRADRRLVPKPYLDFGEATKLPGGGSLEEASVPTCLAQRERLAAALVGVLRAPPAWWRAALPNKARNSSLARSSLRLRTSLSVCPPRLM